MHCIGNVMYLVAHFSTSKWPQESFVHKAYWQNSLVSASKMSPYRAFLISVNC